MRDQNMFSFRNEKIYLKTILKTLPLSGPLGHVNFLECAENVPPLQA